MRNYLVIGGSSGIGLSLAKILDDGGNKVFASYNHTEPDENNTIEYIKYNVLTDDPEVLNIPDVLDGLVYCPGSINLKPFSRIKEEEFIDDFRLNVSGAIKTIQASIPSLKKAESPSIVLFSTVAVDQGFNFHSQVATSKGAIQGLCRALAIELSPKIRVNCIAPSLTKTKLSERLLNTEDKINSNANRHPLKRIGYSEDIANMASFLLSEKSSWITGQILRVDGGISTLKN